MNSLSMLGIKTITQIRATFPLRHLFQALLEGYSTFLEIGSFYNSLRVKYLGFIIFESIQPIF